MTDEAKSWIVDGLKGTSLLAILMAVASGAWLLAQMQSDIEAMQTLLAKQEKMSVGSRLTSLELRLETFSRDQDRLENSLSGNLNRLSDKIERLDSHR